MRTRFLLVFTASLATACATAEDPASTTGPGRVDSAGTPSDSAATNDGEPGTDSAVESDSAAPVDSSTVEDSAAPTDSATPVDSAVADTGEIDSAPVDTGTVMDTSTPPVCSESGKYGGKCKTNLDCAMITGCGYVCCAYDPSGTISLGCGRISGGSFCLP